MRLQTRKHGGPGRHAPGAHIGVFEADSGIRQTIYIRSMCPLVGFRIAADGSRALVVGKYEEDIGAFIGAAVRGKVEAQKHRGINRASQCYNASPEGFAGQVFDAGYQMPEKRNQYREKEWFFHEEKG